MLKTIGITESERLSGQMSEAHRQEAVQAIVDDGLVALTNVAEVAHLDRIYAQMLRDIKVWNAAAPKPVAGGNFTPSRRAELLYADILQNPLVADVLGRLLGKEPSCGMYSSNITLPGLGDQKLHVDMAPPKGGEDFTLPCHAVVVNFPAIDFTVENGATELWPGTHRVSREIGEFEVSQRLQDEWHERSRPVRAVLPRGGVLIRDIRLWHRGTSNHSAVLRPMLALICNGGFKPGIDDVAGIPTIGPVPLAAQPLFCDSPVIHYNSEFVTGTILPGPGHLPRVA